jgi:hypothetical protein
MKTLLLIALLTMDESIHAEDPSSRAAEAPVINSASVGNLVEQARTLAVTRMQEIPESKFSRGSISVYYASRMSLLPAGIVVSFVIRGSFKEEQAGWGTEDRVVVIYSDDALSEPEVKKVSVWLNEDSTPVAEEK